LPPPKPKLPEKKKVIGRMRLLTKTVVAMKTAEPAGKTEGNSYRPPKMPKTIRNFIVGQGIQISESLKKEVATR
jgi:hypothetical protein